MENKWHISLLLARGSTFVRHRSLLSSNLHHFFSALQFVSQCGGMEGKMQFAEIKNAPSGFEVVTEMLGFKSDLKDISLEFKKSENLSVSFDGKKAVIEYGKNYAYRGLGILCEKLNASQDPFEVCEKAVIPDLGIMYDMARNAPFNMKNIKRHMCMAAIMGYSLFMLYVEDMYELEGYPYFGHLRGRYTTDELKEADAFAKMLGITLVPAMQAAAHLEHALRWDWADEIRDTGNCLLVGEEKTYELIEAVVENICKCFSSNRIFIGMDEAASMGTGKYLKLNGRRERIDIFCEHLKRVNNIVRKYGRQPIMWGDMFVSNGSKTHYPHDPDMVFPSKDSGMIPEGMQIVYWDYVQEDKENYIKIFRTHKKAGYTPAFMGGSWSWFGVVPVQWAAQQIGRAALAACVEENINEVWLSVWGDCGGDTDSLTIAKTAQLYAEYAFGHAPTEDELGLRMEVINGLKAAMTDAIAEIDIIKPYPGKTAHRHLSVSWDIMWQDVLLGFMDKSMEDADFETHYSEVKSKLEALRGQVGENSELLERYITLCGVLEVKSAVGIKLKKYYDTDRQALRSKGIAELEKLRERAMAAKQAHRKLWFKNHKAFGWEVFDLRYGTLISRIDTAIWRICEYCEGKTEEIEELAAPRLYFKGNREGIPNVNIHCTWGFFSQITTAGDIR